MDGQVSQIDLRQCAPFRVGRAMIDPVALEARYGGGSERLQPLAVKTLLVLVRRAERVVTRDELVAICWDGRIVSDDVVNRAILLLRGLAKRAGGFRIETVRRSGYRLVEEERAPILRSRWLAGALVAVLVAAGLALGWRPRSQDQPPTPTIAIASFTPDGPQSDALARAVAAALTEKLSDGGFPVRRVQGASAGGGAGADYLINGDVVSSPGVARATVRIEETDHHVVVFSHPFEARGDDIRNLPERAGAQVAASLSWTAALMILDRRQPAEPGELVQRLKQMNLSVEGGDPLQAFELARKNAGRAPDSAIAQLGLAFHTGFALARLPREARPAAVGAARAAQERALRLAPGFGDTRIPWCLLHSPVRMADCEDRLRAGLKADPDAPFVTFYLSLVLTSGGRSSEAHQFAQLAIANDRYKVWKIALMLRTLEEQSRTAESAALYRQASIWWPDHPGLRANRHAGMLAAGAFESLLRLEAEADFPPAERAPDGLLKAIVQKDTKGVQGVCAAPGDDRAVLCMLGLAHVGDLDGSYRIAGSLFPRLIGRTGGEEERIWLDQKDGAPVSLLSSSAAEPLRRDPRFLALARRVGLLAYWRTGRLPDFCTVRHEPVCRQI